MSIKLGVVMDPIHCCNYRKDTTLALLWAAQKRGWHIHYMELSDLYLRDGQVRATIRPLEVFENPEQFYRLGDPSDLSLGELDVILMRKDPPFDNEFLYATYLLETAQRQGALVLNHPASLRDCNEKLFATQFPQLCPPLLVSRDMARLKDFHREHGKVIFKPLDGMGGSGVFLVDQSGQNLGAILESLTRHGRQTIMAQRYLPEIKDGDKRILIVDGEPVPYCLARVPLAGETRGNLAAGGSGRPQPLSPRDWEIAKQVAPHLVEKGLLFVGLDVIGDYLTEINVTSPTCAREIDREFNTDIGGRLMDAIAKRLTPAN